MNNEYDVTLLFPEEISPLDGMKKSLESENVSPEHKASHAGIR